MRCAPAFQLVMMPSSVLLMIASSADSIRAESQYGASSGLWRLVSRSLFTSLSEGLTSGYFRDMILRDSRASMKESAEGVCRGERIIAGEGRVRHLATLSI